VKRFGGKDSLLFDEEGDVLDVTPREPGKAVARELKNDIAIRVDPKTGEILGIVILNFMKKFRLKKKPKKSSYQSRSQ